MQTYYLYENVAGQPVHRGHVEARDVFNARLLVRTHADFFVTISPLSTEAQKPSIETSNNPPSIPADQ